MSMLAEIRCPLVLTVPNHGQKHRLDYDRRAESINRLQSGRLSQVQAYEPV